MNTVHAGFEVNLPTHFAIISSDSQTTQQKVKRRPTVCLCFAIPVVFFCHKFKGLRAAVGVQAST